MRPNPSSEPAAQQDPLHSADALWLLTEAQAELDRGFNTLPAYETAPLPPGASSALAEAASRLHDNYPYHHPLYAGQMLKPPHPVARAAYALATSLNPNNHALDGGRASSAMEVEAVAELAAMVGLGNHLGHLTSGGTFANLEALWIAGQMALEHGREAGLGTSHSPIPAIAASAQAHYTHSRISAVLGLPFLSVPVDSMNRMDVDALEAMVSAGLEGQPIGTVVVTLGTTATGAVDPLDRILPLQRRFGFRIHVDAAYGGYYKLAGNLGAPARAAYDCMHLADSIVIDPHKHGLQPYGCGCVLFRDPTVGRFYKHDSPYTYFTSQALHLGEISLECSRAGASAVALWATQRVLPLVAGGTFAQGLEQGRQAALRLYAHVAQSPLFCAPTAAPQLDIAVWAVGGETLAESSARAQHVFDEAARDDLHLALARLPVTLFPKNTWAGIHEGDTVLCLRSVLMKPEHLVWLPEIIVRLDRAVQRCLGVTLG
jgi:tyrosine decarboxylase/aspartate 1-decarboxylase